MRYGLKVVPNLLFNAFVRSGSDLPQARFVCPSKQLSQVGYGQLPAASMFQLAKKRIRHIWELPCLDRALTTVEPIVRKYVALFQYLK